MQSLNLNNFIALALADPVPDKSSPDLLILTNSTFSLRGTLRYLLSPLPAKFNCSPAVPPPLPDELDFALPMSESIFW